MQFRNAYFTSLVHSSQKLWPKPNLGNSVPRILPSKIGGSWNLMKERYLSKTPYLTFVYLSKCNINLPCFLDIPKKVFMNRSIVQVVPEKMLTEFEGNVWIF